MEIIKATGWYSEARSALDDALVKAYEQGWNEAVEATAKEVRNYMGANAIRQAISRLRIKDRQ